MADFSKEIDGLLKREGVYDLDKDDPGGETCYGITRRDFPKWIGWAQVDMLKKPGEVQPELKVRIEAQPRIKQWAMDFYEDAFWNRARCWEIQDQAVAAEVFDTAVNCGVAIAAKCVEDVLWIGNRDGVDYPEKDVIQDRLLTKAEVDLLEVLVAKRGSAAVVHALNGRQIARYYDLAVKNPRLRKYYWGWQNNRT